MTLDQKLAMMQRQIERLEQKVAGLTARATVQASVDGGERQAADIDIYADDSVGAEVFEPYGLSSRLPNGSSGISIQVGGDSAHNALLCAAPRGDRPTGRASGVVTLWSVFGQRIDLLDDNRVRIAQSDDANAARIEIAADGTIQIQPGQALTVWINGDRVILGADGGDNAGVGRVGDRVAPRDAFSTWCGQVEAGIAGAGGTAPVPTFEALAAGDMAEIAEGSAIVESA